MGKLMNKLQRQLKYTEHKKDAEDCIKIYNWIKVTDKDGRVWSSRWNPLVDVTFVGFPSDERFYKPNITGRTLLKGIENTNHSYYNKNNYEMKEQLISIEKVIKRLEEIDGSPYPSNPDLNEYIAELDKLTKISVMKTGDKVKIPIAQCEYVGEINDMSRLKADYPIEVPCVYYYTSKGVEVYEFSEGSVYKFKGQYYITRNFYVGMQVFVPAGEQMVVAFMDGRKSLTGVNLITKEYHNCFQ